MNQHLHAIDAAGRTGSTRPPRRLAAALRSAAALLGCALCAFAQNDDTSAVERLVAADAAKHLYSDCAETRGEAALIVAATGLVEHQARVVELASDDEQACRDRATIALGMLASPSTIGLLAERLRSVEDRMAGDGVAAAFGLGSVPIARVDSAVASTLTLFSRASWRRQQDVLQTLLTAMTAWPERTERRALRMMYDDDSNRAPEVRALVLELLLPIDGTFTREDMQRVLRRGTDAERIAMVRHLASRTPHENREWLDELMRLASSDAIAEVRTAALQALSRARHLPALDLAARAVERARGAECSQALEAMLAIGGASTRGALEQHIINERDANRIGALLAGFQAPPSRRLQAFALDTATDKSLPMATRVAAGELLARSGHDRAVPVLRDLFRAADDRRQLATLAGLLARIEPEPTPLSRLLDRPVDLTRHPESWRALLLAGHGEAQRAVLAALPRGGDEALAALKAWRKAMVVDEPTGKVPERLREALR